MERDKLLEKLTAAISERRLNDLKKIIKSLNPSMKILQECFYSVVLYNQTEAAAVLLESRPDIIPKDRRCPYLYVAAAHSNLKIIEMLLQKVNEIDKFLASFLLELSINKGNEKVVELVLKKGVSVNSKVKGPRTSIHIAVEKGHLKIIEYLLANGADVNARYDDQRHNCTLLYHAVEMANEAVVQLLLKHGAKVDVKATDGHTPIYAAVENRLVKIAQLLIQNGADVNSKINKILINGNLNKSCSDSKTLRASDKWSLLHIAAEKGCDEMVKLLIDNKANVNVVDSAGKTPFNIAVEKGHIEVVKVFLNCGAEINSKDAKGDTPLHRFAAEGSSESVWTMLQCGLSVDSKNSNERTPLFLAAKNGHEETVKLLVKHGADINHESKNGWTPLHFFSTGGFERSVECLLKCGAKIDSRDSKGRTALYFAAQSGHVGTVKLLQKFGAEIDSSGTDGTTPLSVSILKGKTEVIQVLLKSGASVGSGAMQTHLYNLVETGRDEEAKLLLKYGAKFNSSDSAKLTALLFRQTGRGNVEIVEALLKSGARVDSTPHPERKTPLFYAAEFGHHKVIRLLLDWGADVNNRNILGETPLLAAVFLFRPGTNHMNSIKILLEYGARVDDGDYSASRNTPLSLAAEKYWLPDILRTLLDYASTDATIVRETNMHFLFFIINKYGPICQLVHVNIPAHGVSSAEILVQHTIKMKAADLYVDTDNYKAKTYCNQTVIRRFSSKCEREIGAMKSKSLGGTTMSFYDVLTKRPYQLAQMVKHESVIQIARSGSYKTQFPIYANNICNQFEKCQIRNKLLKDGVNICGFLFKNLPVIPAELKEKILDHLSNFDLRSVTRIFTQNR